MRRAWAKLRRLSSDEEGQAMTETIILIGVVLLALAWSVEVLPQALRDHYAENQKIVASPL